MPSCAMACTSGRGMRMAMADGRGTATAVKGLAQRFGPLCTPCGVQKRDLHLSVATDEAMVNTPQVTPTLIQRMCVHDFSTYSGYT
jgi:hypothetical protein